MEEKLKAPDSQSGDSEVRLFQRCQELQALVQEKEDVIGQLEQQLEEQVTLVHVKNFITATDVLPVNVFFFFVHFKVQKNVEEHIALNSTSRTSLLKAALGMWTIIRDKIALSLSKPHCIPTKA